MLKMNTQWHIYSNNDIEGKDLKFVESEELNPPSPDERLLLIEDASFNKKRFTIFNVFSAIINKLPF